MAPTGLTARFIDEESKTHHISYTEYHSTLSFAISLTQEAMCSVSLRSNARSDVKLELHVGASNTMSHLFVLLLFTFIFPCLEPPSL